MDKNDIYSETEISLVKNLDNETNISKDNIEQIYYNEDTSLNCVFYLNETPSKLEKRHKKAIEHFIKKKTELLIGNKDVNPLSGGGVLNWDEYKNWTLIISSRNNFPTAAGMASSASGFCCFVLVLSVIFQYFGIYQNISKEEKDIDRYIEKR